MEYLKYGLLLHMTAACLMLTNKKGFDTLDRSGGPKLIFNAAEEHDKLVEQGVM